MSKIEDEAYSEALAEIVRLRGRIYLMSQKEGYKERERDQRVIRELKNLVVRAAEALEKESWRSADPDYSFLIGELRAATKNDF